MAPARPWRSLVSLDLLTPDEVLEILRLPSKETLYQWRARGEGPPSFKVGRHLRYPRAELERWIEGRRAS